MEHRVAFEAGHDCIKFECLHGSKTCKPGYGGSHGVHGLSIRFVAKGAEGAVQFMLYTDWLPQFTAPSSIGVRDCKWGGKHTLPADLGYHSRKPRYPEQKSITESCPYCDGEPCYYDGSGLNASDAMYALVNGGDTGLWAFLDAYYQTVFSDAPYPKPAEYAMPLRR